MPSTSSSRVARGYAKWPEFLNKLCKRSWIFFVLGLALVVFYWISIRPPGTQRGYIEDFGHDTMTRQIMADQVREFGGPHFRTQHYGIPDGISVAYMSWTIEASWIGAYFWNWNPDFPFLWGYFGLSLLITYLGVGYILTRMKLPGGAAWGLAAFVTVFHVPRHLVTWNKMQILYLHWVYLSFFLDAWIWQRFVRERRWSWTLELWRGLLLIATFGTYGYFWGPTILEWTIVRGSILWVLYSWRYQNKRKIKIEGEAREFILPCFLIVLLLVIDLRWFIPLGQEALQLGRVSNGLGYFAPIHLIFSPLWIDSLLSPLFKAFPLLKSHWRTITFPETPVTIGWSYWIPALLGIRAIRKRDAGPGVLVIMPFIILLGISVWYVGIRPRIVQYLLQTFVPFMSFFRVMSRWGIFFPILVGTLIALTWPELSKWFKRKQTSWGRKSIVYLSLFLVISGIEFGWLLKPVRVTPNLSPSMQAMLEKIRDLPGSTVLDMPFCLTGGDGMCLPQCPGHPISMAGAFFRGWHKKDVFGIYESRLNEKQCDVYKKQPFNSWLQAWMQHRCFSSQEWKMFCDYLRLHRELSAVLVYGEPWWGGEGKGCIDEIRSHMGPERDQSEFFTEKVEGRDAKPVHVYWFQPRCER